MRGSSRLVAMLAMTIFLLWAAPGRAQTWTYKRETDVMTDRTNHFASVQFGNRHRPMTFYAACRDGDLEMWFAPHDFIGASDVNGPHASQDDSRIYIDYRVNDEQAVEGVVAGLSTDDDAFFLYDHEDMLRGLLGKRLILQWRDFRGTESTVTIPTQGASAALKNLPCAQPFIPNCGDGLLQKGEACDAGRDNSNGRGALCRRDCTVAPAVCGDGVVQVGEECDSAIAASPDSDYRCNAACTTEPIYAELLVPCGAGRSTVLIDGKKAGVCGEVIGKLKPGRVSVLRRSQRTGDFEVTIELVAGHRSGLPALPAVVWLSVSEPGAEIYIGGKLMGRSVETPDGFEIEPGLRTLEVKKDGFVTYTNSVSFSAGAERRVNIVLQPVSAPSSPPAAR
jgi:hypothetical protein